MAITAAQLEQRRGYLGASDFPAILGVDPHRDALRVWQDKMGYPPDDAGDGRKARAGLKREPYLREWLEDELGARVIEPTDTFMHPRFNFIGANPDALVLFGTGETDTGEIKLSGIADGWGPDLSDEVPAKVLTQVLVQLACVPHARKAHVVREFPDRHDWLAHRHVIERNDEVADDIIEAGRKFWTDCVVAKKMPDPDQYAPMLESVKRLRREDGPEVEIDYAAVVAPWEAKRQERLDAEKAEQSLLAVLLAKLGGSRVGVCPEGTFTYSLESAGKRANLEKLKNEHPAVYEAVMEAATRQVPRWKPAGKGRRG